MTRFRLNDRTPWPERRGCTGVIVDPPSSEDAGRYPWHGRGRNEVIVLLDDDPLVHRRAEWSCVVDRGCLDVIAEGDE